MTVTQFRRPAVLNISIHMPHTWHDAEAHGGRLPDWHFNPHATYVA